MSDSPGEKVPAPGSKRGRLLDAASVIGVFVVCLIRLAGFVQDNAVDVLCEDQWDFLKPLFEGRGPWSCFFYQHGPHRLGLGGLVDWYLYHATSWNVRAEAWAAVVVLSLATIAAILLAARLRGSLSWSDAAFPLLLLSPIHWETMTYTPNLAHSILPLLFTFLLAYAWGPAGPTTRILGVGVFGTLTLFTGYGSCGAPVTVGLALLVLLRPGKGEAQVDRRQAAVILLILGVAAAIFARGYHWDRGTPGWRFPVTNWWDYGRFGALMFSSLLGWRALSIASTAVGAIMLGLVVAAFLAGAVMIWRRSATARSRAVWILTGTSLMYAALTAVGRLPVTLQAAFMWRYITLMMPAVCGLALAVEGRAISRGIKFRLGFAVGWMALACVVWSNFRPEDYAATVARGKNLWVASYLQTRDLDAANKASNFWVYSPAPDSPVIAARLRWLEQRHLSFFRKPPNE